MSKPRWHVHNDPGVATAIAWHFAAMWLLLLGYLLFVGWGVLSGHFWRDFLPVGPQILPARFHRRRAVPVGTPSR